GGSRGRGRSRERLARSAGEVDDVADEGEHVDRGRRVHGQQRVGGKGLGRHGFILRSSLSAWRRAMSATASAGPGSSPRARPAYSRRTPSPEPSGTTLI